jgi:hypothetical protein
MRYTANYFKNVKKALSAQYLISPSMNKSDKGED